MAASAKPREGDGTMKRSFFTIALAALLGALSGADRAAADVDCAVELRHVSSGQCNRSDRIDKTSSTCLDAWWDNTYNAREIGYRVKIVNRCGALGNILAHIDRIAARDDVACTASVPWDYYSDAKTRKITCCFESESDLCWREQIEANSDGRIKKIRRDGSTWSWTYIDVSSHRLRYEFCRENPDDVYCKADPSGDANTEPPHPAAECDGALCTVQDCRDHYAGSPAYDTCASISIEYPEWTGSANAHRAEKDNDDNWFLEDNTCRIRNLDDCSGIGISGINMWDGTEENDFVAFRDIGVHDLDDMRVCRIGPYWRGVAGGCPAEE